MNKKLRLVINNQSFKKYEEESFFEKDELKMSRRWISGIIAVYSENTAPDHRQRSTRFQADWNSAAILPDAES